MKRGVLNLGTEVSEYHDKHYKHVKSMLDETKRIMATKKRNTQLLPCRSCWIPCDLDKQRATLLMCNGCLHVYHCGRSFCVKPFNILACSKCDNKFCYSHRNCCAYCGNGKDDLCESCVSICCVCQNTCCDQHIINCDVCLGYVCDSTNCRDVCSICKKTACSNCLKTEGISKTFYCVDCVY